LKGNSTVIFEYENILMGKQRNFNCSFSGSAEKRRQAVAEIWQYAVLHILHWTPEMALKNMTVSLMNSLYLDRTLTQIDSPFVRKKPINFRYIFSIAFPKQIRFDIFNETIDAYNRVLHVEKYSHMEEQQPYHFPKYFFTDENGAKRASICLNYAVNRFLGDMPVSERYVFFSDSTNANAFLKQAMIDSVGRHMYDAPLDFYHFSLPEDERDYLLYYSLKLWNIFRAKERDLCRRMKKTKKVKPRA